MNSSALVYQGNMIRIEGEQLNLTDMRKAAGSDENKRPAEWSRREGASFIEFTAGNHDVAVSHIMRTVRGIAGGFGTVSIKVAR